MYYINFTLQPYLMISMKRLEAGDWWCHDSPVLIELITQDTVLSTWKSMKCIEVTHPDAKQKIMDAGISVRRNKKGVGQAIELAGEHSYMHSAKTGSGLTNSQTKPATLWWCSGS